MKIIGRIISTILVVILSLLSTVSLLSFTMLNSTEDFLSTDFVKEVVKNVDFNELMGDKVEQEVEVLLEKTGIPKEYVNEVLESEELKEYMGTYISESLDYVLYGKELPTITGSELSNVLSNSFNQVITELEKNNINVSEHLSKEQQEKIHEQINVYAPQIAEKIPDAEAFVKDKISNTSEYQEMQKAIDEYNNLMAKVKQIYSYKFAVLIATIVMLCLIVLLKLKKLRFIKFLCIPFLLCAISLKVILVKMPFYVKAYYPAELNFIKTFVDNTLASIYKIWSQYANVYLIITILLIVAQIIVIIIRMIKKNKNNPKLDEETL
ncbi:MAG: hypothetical protein K2J20_03525 [Bacilli bacterium]|nr:hypothetical protein [Bacilli bacterium]